jgi:hypothetical protein
MPSLRRQIMELKRTGVGAENARLLLLSVDPFYTYLCALWLETSVPNVVVYPDTVDEYIVQCFTAFPYRNDSVVAIEWYTNSARMSVVRRQLERVSNTSYRSWHHTDLSMSVSETGVVRGRLFGMFTAYNIGD